MREIIFFPRSKNSDLLTPTWKHKNSVSGQITIFTWAGVGYYMDALYGDGGWKVKVLQLANMWPQRSPIHPSCIYSRWRLHAEGARSSRSWPCSMSVTASGARGMPCRHWLHQTCRPLTTLWFCSMAEERSRQPPPFWCHSQNVDSTPSFNHLPVRLWLYRQQAAWRMTIPDRLGSRCCWSIHEPQKRRLWNGVFFTWQTAR